MRNICASFQFALSVSCVTLLTMAPAGQGQSAQTTTRTKTTAPSPKRNVSAPAKKIAMPVVPAPAKSTRLTARTIAPAPAKGTAHAPRVLASKPAGDDLSRSNRVALLSITGPKIIDINADEVWKIKNKSSAPSQGELVQLAKVLQDALTQQLSGRLGATLVPTAEVAHVATSVAPPIGSIAYQQQIAREVKARYVVGASIDRVEFDGNTVLPDIYSITASVGIIDASTGQTVWSENAKKFTSKIYTKKSAKTVLQNFSETELPDVATYFAARVAQMLGR